MSTKNADTVCNRISKATTVGSFQVLALSAHSCFQTALSQIISSHRLQPQLLPTKHSLQETGDGGWGGENLKTQITTKTAPGRLKNTVFCQQKPPGRRSSFLIPSSPNSLCGIWEGSTQAQVRILEGLLAAPPPRPLQPRDARGPMGVRPASRAPIKARSPSQQAAAIGEKAGGECRWRTACLRRFIFCTLTGRSREVLFLRGNTASSHQGPVGAGLGKRPSVGTTVFVLFCLSPPPWALKYVQGRWGSPLGGCSRPGGAVGGFSSALPSVRL